MAKGEADELDALLLDVESAEKMRDYIKRRQSALVAYSNLRSVSIAMLLCVALFLSMLSARLELQARLKWPVYIDFFPLFILSCLLYIAAADFSATRLSADAALGKVVVVATGFLGAFGLLMLFLMICLRLTEVVNWRWTYVMFPFWMGLLASQGFFCFMIPGFLRKDMLKLFLAAYLMVWMTALAVLLVALKLDGELPGVHWWVLFSPIWVVLLLQVAILDKNAVDVASRLLLLFVGFLLPFRLEGSISLPWAFILLPPVCVIVVNIVQIATGTGTISEL